LVLSRQIVVLVTARCRCLPHRVQFEEPPSFFLFFFDLFYLCGG
jgi:hypothetical protein